MILYLVDQPNIILTRLCNDLIKPEERPKVYFPSYFKTKISVSEVHILSLFPESFSVFPWNLLKLVFFIIHSYFVKFFEDL